MFLPLCKKLFGKVRLGLPDGRKVVLVDGSRAYPFSTQFTEPFVYFYIRESLDADRDVKVFLVFFSSALFEVLISIFL